MATLYNQPHNIGMQYNHLHNKDTQRLYKKGITHFLKRLVTFA